MLGDSSTPSPEIAEREGACMPHSYTTELQPDTEADQTQENAGILMTEILAIESYHPQVFMPFDKDWTRAAAPPFVMHNPGIGYKYDFQPFATNGHAQIQIFTM
jgi:hypothetical protein